MDPTFDPDFGFDGEVWALIMQADGKVVAGGNFTLVRLLNDDGVGDGRIEFTAPAVQVSEVAVSVSLPVRRTVGSRGAVTIGYDDLLAEGSETFVVYVANPEFQQPYPMTSPVVGEPRSVPAHVGAKPRCKHKPITR